MVWAKIEFSGSEAKSQAQWFRAVFMQIVWRLPDAETEHMALYWGHTAQNDPVFYLSPLAAELVAKAMSNYELASCERPDRGLFVPFGSSLASDPAWFDLPAGERQAQLDEIRLSPEEARAWAEDLDEQLGWGAAEKAARETSEADARQSDFWGGI